MACNLEWYYVRKGLSACRARMVAASNFFCWDLEWNAQNAIWRRVGELVLKDMAKFFGQDSAEPSARTV
jgi:hypothetical protein